MATYMNHRSVHIIVVDDGLGSVDSRVNSSIKDKGYCQLNTCLTGLYLTTETREFYVDIPLQGSVCP